MAVQPVTAPKTGIRALFKERAIDVAVPFPWSDQENRYVLIATDYFMKWLEAYAIPN
jgi:hypothetical protein